MEALTSPLFWLIIVLSSITTVLAGELGRYMTRAKYFEEKFEKYYNKWHNLDKSAFESWWIARDLYFKEYSDKQIKEKTNAIFLSLNEHYGDLDD